MYTSMEKYSFACSFLPSPNVFATIALPPVPIMKPRAEIAKRHDQIDSGKSSLSDIIGNKEPVHYTVDGSKDHHDDGRKDEPQ